jgi:hypothetical protein
VNLPYWEEDGQQSFHAQKEDQIDGIRDEKECGRLEEKASDQWHLHLGSHCDEGNNGTKAIEAIVDADAAKEIARKCVKLSGNLICYNIEINLKIFILVFNCNMDDGQVENNAGETKCQLYDDDNVDEGINWRRRRRRRRGRRIHVFELMKLQ